MVKNKQHGIMDRVRHQPFDELCNIGLSQIHLICVILDMSTIYNVFFFKNLLTKIYVKYFFNCDYFDELITNQIHLNVFKSTLKNTPQTTCDCVWNIKLTLEGLEVQKTVL